MRTPKRLSALVLALALLALPASAHAAAPGPQTRTEVRTFPAPLKECQAARLLRPALALQPCVITVTLGGTYTPIASVTPASCTWYPGSWWMQETGPLSVWSEKMSGSWSANACYGLHNGGQNCNQWTGFGFTVSITGCTAWHTYNSLPPGDGACWPGDTLTYEVQFSVYTTVGGLTGGSGHQMSFQVDACGNPENPQYS